MKWSRSHGIPQGGLSQESRAVVRVLYIRDGDGRVVHAIVDHCVDGHGDTVLRQDLKEQLKGSLLMFDYGNTYTVREINIWYPQLWSHGEVIMI